MIISGRPETWLESRGVRPVPSKSKCPDLGSLQCQCAEDPSRSAIILNADPMQPNHLGGYIANGRSNSLLIGA